ncbi:hypothetical protein BY996DRAFT_714024 [Phakopsora pachyrhizi]|nr:hypothetical protein BY996DRAFT_714024 [Phakopsora pachyrhizi]
MNFAQPKVKVKKLIGDTMKNLEDRVLILETLALSAYLIQMANIDANYLEHLGLVEYYLEQIKKMTSDEEYLHFRDLIIKKLKLVVDHGISPKLKTEDLFPVTKTGYKGTLFGLGEHDASKIATKTENQMGSSQNIASRTAGDFSKTNILPTSQREAKLNNPEAVKRNRQRRTRLPLHHQAKYKGTQLNSDGLLKLNLPPYLASRYGGTLIEAHPLPTPQQEANPTILQKAKRINQQGRVGLLLPQQSKYQGKPFNSDRASKINNQLGAPKYLSLEYGSSSTETHPLPIPHQGSKHHNPRLAKSNNQRGAMLPLPGQNEIKEPFFKHYKSINPISTQRTDKKKVYCMF